MTPAPAFGPFHLDGALVYADAGGGVATRRVIPLRQIDCIEASSIATEVYPSRGRVVVHAGNVRLEVTVDGPDAGRAAQAFVAQVEGALTRS